LAIREHPRFWLALVLLITLVSFTLVFEFFTGLLGILLSLLPIVGVLIGTSNPAYLPVESSVALGPPIGLPPIAIVQSGYRFVNVTYLTSSNGLKIVWEYWYYFPPTTGHPANDWEPVYVYWDLTGLYPGGPGPQLVAIGVRIHFAPRLIYPPFPVNVTQTATQPVLTIGAQPYISFGYSCLGTLCGIVPTVKQTIIGRFLKPSNATVIFNYPLSQDPNSPPSSGPLAYEQGPAGNAGPFDPWILLNGLTALQAGLVWGTIFGGSFGLGSYAFIQLAVHPHAPIHRVRVRKRLLPFIET
jgi:hypothetical protein